MLTETLIALFERDLNRVVNEIKSYADELNIWRVEQGIANSAGNLALHLIGNLNTYIGKEIGKTDFIRNRELEFSAKVFRGQVWLSSWKKPSVWLKVLLDC